MSLAIKIHRSTIFFVLLVAICLFLANFPGQIALTPPMDGNGQYGPAFDNMWEVCHHGWPFTFLIREAIQVKNPPNPRLPVWGSRLSLWRVNEGVVAFHRWHLAGDIVSGLLVMMVGGMLFEKWRRRRNRLLQLHLIDVILLVTVAACALSYWATNARYRERQEQVLKTIRQNPNREKHDIDYFAQWELGGPTWLKEIFGDRMFSAFDRVVEISCVSSDKFQELLELRNLKAIEFLGTLTEDQIEELAKLPDLEAVNFHFLGVTIKQDTSTESSSPSFRLPKFPRLRALNLYQSEYMGEGLDTLENLEVLDLTENYDFGDKGAMKLEGLKKLRILSLAQTKVADEGLKYLSRLDKLESLSLGNTEISDQGLRHLPTLKNLTFLDLSVTKIKGQGLKYLESLTKLKTLILDKTEVTDQGLQYLKSFRNLERLNLSNTKVTEQGLQYLKPLKNLKILYLDSTKVTDQGLPHLKTLTKLEWLSLQNTQVTATAKKQFQQSSPKCYVQ